MPTNSSIIVRMLFLTELQQQENIEIKNDICIVKFFFFPIFKKTTTKN